MAATGSNRYASSKDRKIVVLRLPRDVDADGLKEYMSKFGEIDDVVVMKDRVSGSSRGFGYVTFTSPEDAQRVAGMQHMLNGCMLEVKIAIPKEEIRSASAGKTNRIFIARIPQNVTDDMFRSYFAKFGVITDSYMPKDHSSRTHRGIGFVTFENSESVDKVMNETHELGGSVIAVDCAAPKDEALNFLGKALSDAYMNAAAQFGAFGSGESAPSNFHNSGFPNFMGPTSLGDPNAVSNFWASAVRSAHGLDDSRAENESSMGSSDVTGHPNNRNNNVPPASLSESCELLRGASGSVSLVTSTAISGNSNPPVNSSSLNGMMGVAHNSVPAATSTFSTSAGYSFNAPSFPSARRENKIFVGRLPIEATAEHLRTYFSRFGQISDVYVPKDASKKGHRGFGFVTFVDHSVAERVSCESHEILGQSIAVDRPMPQDGSGSRYQFPSTVSNSSAMSGGDAELGYQAGMSPGSMAFGTSQGNTSYNNIWSSYTGRGPMSSSGSDTNFRYRPY